MEYFVFLNFSFFFRGSVPKPPVDVLVLTGLGNAISTAVAAATRLEKDGLVKVTSIETGYPEVDKDVLKNGR